MMNDQYEQVIKSLVAEFLGTFTLVLIGCMAVASFEGDAANSIGACFAFGLALMGIIYTWGSYSGAHVNPAVSFGFAVAGRMGWLMMFAYWIVQFIGAIFAAGLVAYFLPGTDLGVSSGKFTQSKSGYYDLGKALFLEMILTFFLVMVILFVTKNKLMAGFAGLAIGLTLTFCMFGGYEWTGASLNPARSLGPAIFGQQLNIYWVYLIGPLLGGLLAALVFRLFNWDWSCQNLKTNCGKVIKDDCGNNVKICKVAQKDQCGNPVKDCGKNLHQAYVKIDKKLGYM